MSKLEHISYSPEETAQLGYHLGQNLSTGAVICLSGDLGAGKTTLVQGLGKGWGITEPLTSPTFVIVHQHRRTDGQTLHHIDAYRLSHDAETIGLEDILAANGIVIIEWAEQIQAWLPAHAIWLTLDYHETQEEARYITLEAGEDYLKKIREVWHVTRP